MKEIIATGKLKAKIEDEPSSTIRKRRKSNNKESE